MSLAAESQPSPQPWYASLPGRRTARRLARVIAPVVRLNPTQRLLALGYAPPVLTGLDPSRLERLTIILTHAPPHRWPARGPNHAAAAQADHLPLPPNLYDQALLVHALDTPDPQAVLAEVWRILAPAGELVLIVPNRLGRLFAPTSPFATGQAYTEGELASVLEQARFEIRSQTTALGRLAPRARIVLAVKTDGLAPLLVGRVATARVPALASGLVPA
jgi:SAM-dependent methyltransferase